MRLAEELAVLDNISRGRVDLIVAGGYVREEFAMFDVPMKERAKRVTEVVTTLKSAFAGEPFSYRGRTVRVTPARRAAWIADGFVPSVPEVWEYYRDEVGELGRPDPGPSPIGPNQVVALAEDPDEGGERMAPFFLHETNAYGEWQAQDDVAAPFRTADGLAELRRVWELPGNPVGRAPPRAGDLRPFRADSQKPPRTSPEPGNRVRHLVRTTSPKRSGGFPRCLPLPLRPQGPALFPVLPRWPCRTAWERAPSKGRRPRCAGSSRWPPWRGSRCGCWGRVRWDRRARWQWP
ncbi:LLM class flavin-dependent oxidoreductase [Streptomyces sp. NBC_00989]|nr:LLM class flavin-dependent oxidoreductase [Streptomyces sp. NBC_00989]